MEQKLQTLIKLPNYGILKRIDGFLYHPVNCIIINGIEYHEWHQYDEFDSEGCIVRVIWLKP